MSEVNKTKSNTGKAVVQAKVVEEPTKGVDIIKSTLAKIGYTDFESYQAKKGKEDKKGKDDEEGKDDENGEEEISAKRRCVIALSRGRDGNLGLVVDIDKLSTMIYDSEKGSKRPLSEVVKLLNEGNSFSRIVSKVGRCLSPVAMEEEGEIPNFWSPLFDLCDADVKEKQGPGLYFIAGLKGSGKSSMVASAFSKAQKSTSMNTMFVVMGEPRQLMMKRRLKSKGVSQELVIWSRTKEAVFESLIVAGLYRSNILVDSFKNEVYSWPGESKSGAISTGFSELATNLDNIAGGFGVCATIVVNPGVADHKFDSTFFNELSMNASGCITLANGYSGEVNSYSSNGVESLSKGAVGEITASIMQDEDRSEVSTSNVFSSDELNDGADAPTVEPEEIEMTEATPRTKKLTQSISAENAAKEKETVVNTVSFDEVPQQEEEEDGSTSASSPDESKFYTEPPFSGIDFTKE